MYDTVTAGDPQVSPDGTRLVYSLGRADRETRPRHQPDLAARPSTAANPRQLTWSGDRNREAALVARRPLDRLRVRPSSRAAAGCSSCPSDGPGEARELTHHAHAIGHLAWSPDGRSIAYTTTFDPDNPDEKPRPEGQAPKVRVTRRLDYKQDNRGWVNDVRSQVFVVDVASGARRMLTREPDDVLYPQWSPDGRRLAARRHRRQRHPLPPGADRRRGRQAAPSSAPKRGSVGVWSWSPGGDRILFSGDTEPTPAPTCSSTTWPPTASERLTTDLPCSAGRRLSDGPRARPSRSGSTTARSCSTPSGPAQAACIPSTSRLGRRSRRRARRRGPLSAGFSTDAATATWPRPTRAWTALGEIAVYDRNLASATVITQHNTSPARIGATRHLGALRRRARRHDRRGLAAEAGRLRPGAEVPGRARRPRRAARLLRLRLQRHPAGAGQPRLPGRLLESARLRLVRPRVRRSRCAATGAARTTST